MGKIPIWVRFLHSLIHALYISEVELVVYYQCCVLIG